MNWNTDIDQQNPRLAPYFRLRTSTIVERLGQGYFVAETQRVVRQMLHEQIEFVSVLGTDEHLVELECAGLSKKVSAENVFCAPKEQMESIVGFNLHQGIMAIGKKPSEFEIEHLEDRIVVLNKVINPENVGSIVRSARAFGISSFLLDHDSVDPYIRRSIRVSMGSVFGSRVTRSRNITHTLRELQTRGYEIVGSDLKDANCSIHSVDFSKKVAIVVGSEAAGMTEEVKSLCDKIASIPTRFPLNAAQAASIFFYEASKTNH